MQDRYTLLSIELEQKEPGCSFIGRAAKLTGKNIALAKIDSYARAFGTEKFAFKHITKLDFDDGYVNAIALVNKNHRNHENDTAGMP